MDHIAFWVIDIIHNLFLWGVFVHLRFVTRLLQTLSHEQFLQSCLILADLDNISGLERTWPLKCGLHLMINIPILRLLLIPAAPIHNPSCSIIATLAIAIAKAHSLADVDYYDWHNRCCSGKDLDLLRMGSFWCTILTVHYWYCYCCLALFAFK
jgi:hypothetical protein